MRVRRFGGHVAAMGLVLAMATTWGATDASARTRSSSAHGASHASASGGHSGAYGRHYAGRGGSVSRYAVRTGGLQCVPFARENTGIELAGNANTWWNNAEGIYERGAKPEVGSILNFRANGRMRMGHVAVVSNVVDPRNIEIDHANWAGPGAGRGGVSRNITVVDVSPGNDWTAVRVALGHSEEFGSVYPTFGFIYDRPDRGIMVANNATASALALKAAPRDLRPAGERYEAEEVAEAADDAPIGSSSGARYRRVATRHGSVHTVRAEQFHGRNTMVRTTAPLGRKPSGTPAYTKVQTRTPAASPAAHRPGKHRT